jgi:hypothetical protein
MMPFISSRNYSIYPSRNSTVNFTNSRFPVLPEVRLLVVDYVPTNLFKTNTLWDPWVGIWYTFFMMIMLRRYVTRTCHNSLHIGLQRHTSSPKKRGHKAIEIWHQFTSEISQFNLWDLRFSRRWVWRCVSSGPRSLVESDRPTSIIRTLMMDDWRWRSSGMLRRL